MSMAKTLAKRLPGILAPVLLVLSSAQWAWAITAEERVDHRTQVALAMDAHPVRGGQYYAQYCARCHGAKGQGDAGTVVPALAGQRFAYLVRQLANFAGAERESPFMHDIATQPAIDEPQSWVDLASYLNRLAPPTDNQTGTGEAVPLGRGIFHEQCVSCHGQDAGGDKEGFVPSLRHQHYGYLNKQMHRLAEGSRHNVDEDLVLFMRSFDERDMRATADYLSRLKGAGTVRKIMRQDGVVVN